jgi:hypothetical protein
MKTLVAPMLAVAAALVAGCGSAKQTAPPTTPATTGSITAPQTASGPGALHAEAQSAATGDIPDNQAFVRFADPSAGYTMKYPEGWAQSGRAKQVFIRDKNNIIRVVVQSGSLPSRSAVTAAVGAGALAGARIITQPQRVKLPSGSAVKVVYSTQSRPNPVTGKRVTLVVDRYYLAHAGKEATVDLGTPQGVDNVDAYRLMIDSFRWR